MCAPSAPKAPPAAPKQDPRVLLSRKSFDDILLDNRTPPAGIGGGSGGGGGGGLNSTYGVLTPMGGGVSASGLRFIGR